MTSIFVVGIALALASAVAAQGGLPACNSLKPEKFDPKWLISSGPFIIYRSNTLVYKCGLAIWVGPAGDNTDYTGTSILISGNNSFSYDFNLINNSVFKSLLCANGVRREYKTVYVNSKSPSASICVVLCDEKDATKYERVVCSGRTSKDERDIDKFLDSILKGLKDVVNLQTGCPKPKYCDLFTN